MLSEKPITESRRNMTPQKIARVYEGCHSIRRTAARLNLSTTTVSRYLHKSGTDVKKRGRPSTGRTPKNHKGAFAEWLRAHPGVKLPRSPTKIAALAGCSCNAVGCYLYRRGKMLRDNTPSQRILEYINPTLEYPGRKSRRYNELTEEEKGRLRAYEDRYRLDYSLILMQNEMQMLTTRLPWADLRSVLVAQGERPKP